jgi:trans-2,3-dihydro-3-hydroxyanthranilate isomerase
MLRPSRIHVSADLEDNCVTKVFVGGRTIPVASGRLFLP